MTGANTADIETRRCTETKPCLGSCDRCEGCRPECPIGPDATLMNKYSVERREFSHDTRCEEEILPQQPPLSRSVVAGGIGSRYCCRDGAMQLHMQVDPCNVLTFSVCFFTGPKGALTNMGFLQLQYRKTRHFRQLDGCTGTGTNDF